MTAYNFFQLSSICINHKFDSSITAFKLVTYSTKMYVYILPVATISHTMSSCYLCRHCKRVAAWENCAWHQLLYVILE